MYANLETVSNCIKILQNMLQTLKSFLLLLGPKAIIKQHTQIVTDARKRKLPGDWCEVMKHCSSDIKKTISSCDKKSANLE